MPKWTMRPTRLLYVENDPALRSILGTLIGSSKEIELLGKFGSSGDVLEHVLAKKADVALIDFALDQNGLNGIELGIALRDINEYMGIVIYSQFSVRPMVTRVPKSMRSGWSFFDKSATMEREDYVRILKETSNGKGNWEDVVNNNLELQESESSIFYSLTPRQRSIMALCAKGMSAMEISSQLGISYSYVRKELSRTYTILLPDVDSTSDLKTAAILKYLELMRQA